MSLAEVLVNLLLAFLAFFVVRYISSMVVPEGDDKDKIVNIVAIVVAILVFFANFAASIF